MSFYQIKVGEYCGVFLSLIERITAAQKGKGDHLSHLIEDFSPLLRKYATRLDYEDAFADIQFDFIKFVYNFKVDSFYPREDQYVLGYLEKAMKHAYIKRSKEKSHFLNHYEFFDDLSVFEKNCIEKSSATYDKYSELDVEQLKKLLPPCQFQIIYLLYYSNLSVKETGQALGISRQSVNQTKKKALAKLREVCLWY